MKLKTLALLSSFIFSLSAWGSCPFVKDTKTDASELVGKTVRTTDGEYKINSVSRAYQLHSSGRFAVCNNIRLEISSIDGQEKKKLTFSTNLPYTGMQADHLLAEMEDKGVYLTQPLTVQKENGQIREIGPSFIPLMRSKKLSVCLQRTTICSY